MLQTNIDFTGDLFAAPAASAVNTPAVKKATPATPVSRRTSTVRTEDRLARAARITRERAVAKSAKPVPTETVEEAPAPAVEVAPMPSAPVQAEPAPLAPVSAPFAFEPIPSGVVPMAAAPFSIFADVLAQKEKQA